MTANEEILKLAQKAADNAYCEYSKFSTGACAVYESGRAYTGCNVENASYGLTLCAERNAMSNAVNAGEKTRLVKIAVFSPRVKLCFPCGACLQWISEFSKGFNTEIILEDKNSRPRSFYINDLMPCPFSL